MPTPPGPEGTEELKRQVRESLPERAAEAVMTAVEREYESTGQRRALMELDVGPGLASFGPVDEYPLCQIVDNLRERHNQVELALGLPITPEYLAHDIRDDFVAIAFEHGVQLRCQRADEPYPANTPNDQILQHAAELRRWADQQEERSEIGYGPTQLALIRETAEYMTRSTRHRRPESTWA